MLKKLIKKVAALSLLAIVISCNNNPRDKMPQTGNFGAQVNQTNYITVEDVLKKLQTEKETMVTVSGAISEFCKGEGCWITLSNKDGEALIVETENKSFVLPNNLTGKTAIVTGKAFISTNQDGKAEPMITATGIFIK